MDRSFIPAFLAGGLLLLAPLVAAGLSDDLWTDAGMSFRAAGDLVADLASHPKRRVARAAMKSTDCVAAAADSGLSGEGETFFRHAQKAAKRLEKLRKAALKAGEDTGNLHAAMEEIVTCARRIIYAAIAEVKARGDFLTDDDVVRAAARAEVFIEKAKAALAGKKPCQRATKACRKAFLSLAAFL